MKWIKLYVCVCVHTHITHLFHTHLFEGNLEQLEVMDVFVLQFGTKLHFLQRQRTVKQHVHELAVCST